jgi:hypothetical protein
MHERPEDPATPADEARAAAEEAAAIGGPDPYPELDPAERPVAEAGGGEAEGFEQAEELLMRQATHDDADGHPMVDAFAPEVESDQAGAEYGEADDFGEHEDHGELLDPDEPR